MGRAPNPERPLCAGTLRDGKTRCVYRAAPGELFCARHIGRVADTTTDDSVEAFVSDVQHDPVAAAEIRTKLGGDLGENYGKVVGALFAAMEAKKPHKDTCHYCHKVNHWLVPDHGQAVRAVEVAMSLGLGKPPQATAESQELIDTDVDITKMTLAGRKDLKRRLVARLGGRGAYLNKLSEET